MADIQSRFFTPITETLGSLEDGGVITLGESSLYAINKAFYYHIHGPTIKYPLRSSGNLYTTLTSSATAMTDGTKVEIIPANAVDQPFDLHWVEFDNITAEGRYEMTLYVGPEGEEEVWGAPIPFARSSNFSREGSKTIMRSVVPANSRVSASIAKGTSGAGSVSITLEGHTYPNGVV